MVSALAMACFGMGVTGAMVLYGLATSRVLQGVGRLGLAVSAAVGGLSLVVGVSAIHAAWAAG